MTRSDELASLPLGQRIAMVIDASKLLQEQVAARFGVSREAVNRWINDGREPKRPNRDKLAELATEVYGEQISPDLFREHVRERSPSVEESLREIRDAMNVLVGLLAEQRDLVAEMSRLVGQLRPPEAQP